MESASSTTRSLFLIGLLLAQQTLLTEAIAQSPYDELVVPTVATTIVAPSPVAQSSEVLPPLGEPTRAVVAESSTEPLIMLEAAAGDSEQPASAAKVQQADSTLPSNPTMTFPRRLPNLDYVDSYPANSAGMVSKPIAEPLPEPAIRETSTILKGSHTAYAMDCELRGCNATGGASCSPKVYSVETTSTIPSGLPWGEDEKVTISVRDSTIGNVLGLIAEQHGLNLVTADQVTGNISLSLNQVPLHQALDTILSANGYTWSLQQGILVVSSMQGDSQLSSIAQGKLVRVFELDFAAAADLDRVVKGLLSPVGQSFIMETDAQDKRKTHETLIVEDLPSHVARIESYISQADNAPRQVLIEANILEVDLNNDLRHGVDLSVLANLANANVTLGSTGFADDTANPAFFFGIDGTDLDGLVELIMTTTDAKKLASPKVLALNGQDARIQIGSSLAYFETTTTQTSTLQSVAFLDTGIVLQVTPIVSHDGRVLMSVKPEVSGGAINAITGLPDRDTTEVETTLMLSDGQAMIIGGLIQEEDIETQSKVPYLGDMWKIGRLFQKRNVIRKRSEIIITLVPHILPLNGEKACEAETDISRSMTPLLEGPLNQVDRRMWEPKIHDAVEKPINR